MSELMKICLSNNLVSVVWLRSWARLLAATKLPVGYWYYAWLGDPKCVSIDMTTVICY